MLSNLLSWLLQYRPALNASLKAVAILFHLAVRFSLYRSEVFCGRLLTEHFECAVSMPCPAVYHTVAHSEQDAAAELCVLACAEVEI